MIAGGVISLLFFFCVPACAVIVSACGASGDAARREEKYRAEVEALEEAWRRS